MDERQPRLQVAPTQRALTPQEAAAGQPCSRSKPPGPGQRSAWACAAPARTLWFFEVWRMEGGGRLPVAPQTVSGGRMGARNRHFSTGSRQRGGS